VRFCRCSAVSNRGSAAAFPATPSRETIFWRNALRSIFPVSSRIARAYQSFHVKGNEYRLAPVDRLDLRCRVGPHLRRFRRFTDASFQFDKYGLSCLCKATPVGTPSGYRVSDFIDRRFLYDFSAASHRTPDLPQSFSPLIRPEPKGDFSSLI
jgi:hypothetical protein